MKTQPDYGHYAEDAARPGAVILAALTTQQNRITHASLSSGAAKLQAVHGGTTGHWHETHDLLDDLHGAWAIAFERENPGDLARQARAAAEAGNEAAA